MKLKQCSAKTWNKNFHMIDGSMHGVTLPVGQPTQVLWRMYPKTSGQRPLSKMKKGMATNKWSNEKGLSTLGEPS